MHATSAARFAANRTNSQFSTGPRTEAGKAISSQNARTHGLCAQELIVQPHEQPEFEELLQAHRDDLQPQGALEQTLFDLIVHATWNLRRIRRMEAGLCRGLDPLACLDDDTLQKKLDRLGRHQTRLECSFARSLRQLKKLQTERSHQAARSALSQPKSHSFSGFPPQPHSLASPASGCPTHFRASQEPR